MQEGYFHLCCFAYEINMGNIYMGKRVALIGDGTTTGGIIISGENQTICFGQSVAVIGNQATCPACDKGIGTIVEGAQNMVIFGKAVAYDGCRIACGCPDNRIIATKSHISVEPSSGDASVLASQLLTQGSSSKEKEITKMFWTYGDSFTPLSDQSRFYTDMTLHLETLNYDVGETIEVTLKKEDGTSLTDAAQEVIITGTVDENGSVVIKNPLQKYTLNLG